MQERGGAGQLARQHGRRAGEAAHRQHGSGRAFSEELARGAERPPGTTHEAAQLRPGERDRRQCYDGHADRSLDGLLVHLFRGNQQGDRAIAPEKFLSHCHSREEMPPRATTSDGDGEFGGGALHQVALVEGRSAKVRLSAKAGSGSAWWRATFSNRPTLASMVTRLVTAEALTTAGVIPAARSLGMTTP